MEIYEGKLERISSGTSTSDMTTYTLVEIGDEVVKNLVLNNKLDSFLRDGVNTSQPTKLWTISMPFRKRGLIAVQIGEGKKYVAPPFSFFTSFFFTVLFSLMAWGCFTLKGMGMVAWVIGGLLLAEVLWFFVMPVVGYFNSPRDGIRL